MRKVIAAINMTIDGVCDHTVGIVDDELMQHYTDLLSHAGVSLYGRITYELMEYWRPLVENPTGNKADDDFAVVMDQLPKIVFSHTLKSVNWHSAKLASRGLEEEVLALKQHPGKDILAGSPSMIAALTRLNLIDEYQLCVHPIIAGKGLPLFKDIADQKSLKLLKTKTFASGVIVLYYEAVKP